MKHSWVAITAAVVGLIACSDASTTKADDESDPGSTATGDSDPVDQEGDEDSEDEDDDSLTGGGDTDQDTDMLEDTAPLPTYELSIELTMDDAWEMWLDGEFIGVGKQWSHADVYSEDIVLNYDGEHVIAVHGWDTMHVISGFLAVVTVDGSKKGITGDGSWKMIPEDPGPEFILPQYDSSHWGLPLVCSNTAPWNGQPASLVAQGAQWVWDTTNCSALGEAWFRLEFMVP